MIATFAAMQSMGPSLPSDKNPRLEASLGLNAIVRAAPQPQRLVRLAKFSRLTVLPRIHLASRLVPQRSIAAVALAKPPVDFIEKTQVLALAKALQHATANVPVLQKPVDNAALQRVLGATRTVA